MDRNYEIQNLQSKIEQLGVAEESFNTDYTIGKNIDKDKWLKMDLSEQTYLIYLQTYLSYGIAIQMGRYLKANFENQDKRYQQQQQGGGRGNNNNNNSNQWNPSNVNTADWRPPLPPFGMIDKNDPQRKDTEKPSTPFRYTLDPPTKPYDQKGKAAPAARSSRIEEIPYIDR